MPSFDDLKPFIVLGFALGGVFAMQGVGLVVLYQATGVLNLAYGAIGAAGATRLRTALATVMAAILDEGLDAETAVGLPRIHPTAELVDAEPGVDDTALTTLEDSGRTVRRWDRLHHYFGGVSCVGRAGAAGDPRRSGAALLQ